MLKTDRWLFAKLIFYAHLFICNNANSSSSNSTTNSTSTTKQTINPSTIADTIGSSTLCTTAGTTNTASTTTEHTIIGIGSVVVVAVVVLVAVCYYRFRRRKQAKSGTNISMNNTGLYETHTHVSGQDNYDQIIRITSGRENNMLERVYNNEEPEYLMIEE